MELAAADLDSRKIRTIAIQKIMEERRKYIHTVMNNSKFLPDLNVDETLEFLWGGENAIEKFQDEPA